MFTKTLRRIKNTLARNKTTSISFEPMWFLSCDIEKIKTADLTSRVKKALLDIRENGVAILPGNINPEDCDALVSDFEAYVASAREAFEYRDENGLHERLCNLQMVSENARGICFNENTAGILQAAFSSEFTVVGSLFFEKGSTQSQFATPVAISSNPSNPVMKCSLWQARSKAFLPRCSHQTSSV